MTAGLSRARQELAAVRLLSDNGFPGQAMSRAYYAAFYAAEAALLVLGETRSKHSGVLSAFGRLVVHDGGLDPEAWRLLRSLFNRRGEADCSFDPITDVEGTSALTDASYVVDAVEAWIAARRTGGAHVDTAAPPR